MSAPEPTTISYVSGDATRPQGEGPKVIAHVCNDYGGWGAGFVLALSKRWPQPEADYRKWAEDGEDFVLGNVRYVGLWQEQIIVANMIAQHGYGDDGPPIRYDALARCLADVALHCLAGGGGAWASVHMPRIGCGLAGGLWEEVEPIIVRELCHRGVPVTVYDYDPPTRHILIRPD